MPQYDLVYIVKPDLDTEAMSSVIERATQRLIEQGAAVEHTDVWGKRRMAYPIARYREGHYVFARFSVSGDRIPEIRHGLKVIEDILRTSITVAVGAIAPPKTAQPAAAPSEVPVVVSGPQPEPAQPDSLQRGPSQLDPSQPEPLQIEPPQPAPPGT
ncbi:MAG: 30S ribosomal protein S6 [Armatimonadetes bacterium]|nr:30S ribosomal protein S6 [Armatimonadota bacterium]